VGKKMEGMWTELMLWQRLQAKDLENWEQRRVKRLPGEVDGVME
jgi:hypothetical protein